MGGRERADGTALEQQDRGAGLGDLVSRRPGRSVMARGGRCADDLGLTRQQPRQVEQVGRLLDDLAAALTGVRPPGRWRRLGEPPSDDQSGRRDFQAGAKLGKEIERSKVVADRDDQPGPFDGRGQPDRALTIVRGERLLRQERDPELDQALADGHRPIRRDADIGNVGADCLDHPVERIERQAAPRAGQRLRTGSRP